MAVLRSGKQAAAGSIEEPTRQATQYKFVPARRSTTALLGAFRESGAGVERVNGHMLLTVDDVTHLNALVDKLRAGGEACWPSSRRFAPRSKTYLSISVRAVDLGAQPSVEGGAR